MVFEYLPSDDELITLYIYILVHGIPGGHIQKPCTFIPYVYYIYIHCKEQVDALIRLVNLYLIQGGFFDWSHPEKF